MKKQRKENSSLMYLTQEEVAKALGISRATVLQVEKSAIEKFKRALRKKYGKNGLVNIDDIV